jgi:hypothetical protein
VLQLALDPAPRRDLSLSGQAEGGAPPEVVITEVTLPGRTTRATRTLDTVSLLANTV